MRRIREPRFLRSDGKPSFSMRVYKGPSELEKFLVKPVVSVTENAPIIDALRKMTTTGKRRLIVVDGENKLRGIITSTDIVSYFCGGKLFDIIKNRHKYNIYQSYQEPVKSIMVKDVIKGYYSEKIFDIIEKMVKNRVGGIPILLRDEKVYGIITERDILLRMSDEIPVVNVETIMNKNIVSIQPNTTIVEAVQVMLEEGYRRLPVTVNDKTVGVLTAMDIIRYLSSNKPFQKSITGNIKEAIDIKVSDVASTYVIRIDKNQNIKKAFEMMVENNIGMLIVEESSKTLGIITERDIFLCLVLDLK